MTIASIIAAITAIGTIVSSLLYAYKQFKTTPEEAKQNIDKSVSDQQKDFEDSGRP